MYKNMKIEINSEQPLEEVVKELERLGYKIIGAFKSRGGCMLPNWGQCGLQTFLFIVEN